MAIDGKSDICGIDIAKLQQEQEKQNVMIHFNDTLIPEKEADDVRAVIDGHF